MTDAPTADPLWSKRWLVWASEVLTLGAMGLLAATHHDEWNWALFGWGIGIGLFGSAFVGMTFVLLRRRGEVNEQQATRFRRRQCIYLPIWLSSGLIAGIAAAAFNAVWIDIVAAAYVLATLTAGVIAAAAIIRHRGNAAGG